MAEQVVNTTWEPQLLEPTSACSSCIDTLDDLDWATTTTVRIGEWALGVRSSTLEMDDVLRRVLGAHVVDVEAPANFSALMADGRTRPFNFLYRASDALVRTRARGRLVRTLIAHLSEFAAPTETAAPAVRLNAAAVIADGAAILIPEGFRAELAGIETRLNVAGLRVVDAPTLELERGGHIVVPEPAVAVDTAALAEYELDTEPLGRELPPVLPGRYPIRAWAFVTGEPGAGPVGRAQGIAAAAQQVMNAADVGAQATLETVAGALADASLSGIWWEESGQLVSSLRALADGAA
jgi:hypothetical protein